MVASEKQINANNQEAHLSVIKSEVDETIAELNSLVPKVDEAKATISAASKAKEDCDSYITEERKKLESDKLDFENSKRADIALKATRTSELNKLQKDISEATKTLNKINNSCITGKTDIESLNSQIAVLNGKVEELTNLVIKYEETKESVRLLEIEREKVLLDISDAKNKSGILLSEQNEELERVKNLVKEEEAKRDKAELDLKSYLAQLQIHMSDYAIIKARLEDRWHQTFPELAIPM